MAKIKIKKQLKARLLNAIEEGVFDTDKFPELKSPLVDWEMPDDFPDWEMPGLSAWDAGNKCDPCDNSRQKGKR